MPGQSKGLQFFKWRRSALGKSTTLGTIDLPAPLDGLCFGALLPLLYFSRALLLPLSWLSRQPSFFMFRPVAAHDLSVIFSTTLFLACCSLVALGNPRSGSTGSATVTKTDDWVGSTHVNDLCSERGPFDQALNVESPLWLQHRFCRWCKTTATRHPPLTISPDAVALCQHSSEVLHDGSELKELEVQYAQKNF